MNARVATLQKPKRRYRAAYQTEQIPQLSARLAILVPADPAPPPLRPWREISRELANETNRDRIIKLHHELNRALAEQLFRNHSGSKK
jgi:hypothetical protein